MSSQISFENIGSGGSPVKRGPVTSRGVSYDPTDKASIQQFLNNPLIQKEIYRNESTGDLYYLDRENSSFIIIEDGNFDKILSIKVNNLSSDGSKWEKVTGEQLQQRARVYMVAKGTINQGVDKINKDRKDKDKITFTSFVIDPDHVHVRGYVNPHKDATSVKTGTLIEVDKSIWERIKNIVETKDEKADRRISDKKTSSVNQQPIDEEEEAEEPLSNGKIDPNWDLKKQYSFSNQAQFEINAMKKNAKQFEITNKTLYDIYNNFTTEASKLIQNLQFADQRQENLQKLQRMNNAQIQNVRDKMNQLLENEDIKEVNPENSITDSSSPELIGLNNLLKNHTDLSRFIDRNLSK